MPQGCSICLIPSTVQIRTAFCLPTTGTPHLRQSDLGLPMVSSVVCFLLPR